MSFVEIFIVFIIVVILVYYIHNYVNSEVEYVKSTIDGRSYLVLSLPDKQNAADYLADINKDIVRFIKYLRAKYPDDEDYQRLYNRYDPDKISEGSPDSNYTSYTVNKSALVLCIRQNDDRKTFVEKNVMMYPLLHELVHMQIIAIGHVPEYWVQFKKFIQEAVDFGIYTRIDFKNNPTPYCGLVLSSHV